MLFKLAWRNIFRNKRRSLITVSSILFAVVSAVFMRSLQFGAYEHMIHNVVGSYLGYVQVHEQGFWEEKNIDLAFETAQLDSISKVRGVQGSSYRIESFALASHDSISKPVALLGLEPEGEAELIGLDEKVVEGQYLNSTQEGVMVAIHLAELLQVKVGDTLTFIGQGYHGSFAADQYPVIGLIDLKTPELNKRTIILSYSLAQEFFGMPGMATTAVVGTAQNNWNKVQERLASAYPDLEVMNWKEMVPELVQLIRADRAGGTVVLIILYMIIGLGLLGTVLMLTEERRYEYGVLLAVGMKKTTLFAVSFIETLLMGFLGVFSGLMVAFPVVFYFNRNPIRLTGDGERIAERFGFEALLPTSLDIQIALTQGAVIFLTVVLVNTYVLYKLKRMQPVKAMKP